MTGRVPGPRLPNPTCERPSRRDRGARRQSTAPPRHPLRLRVGDRRVQRRRRQRLSGARGHSVLGSRALAVTADSAELSRSASPARRARGREFQIAHEIIRTRRDPAAGVPRQPRQPLLLLQAGAVSGARRAGDGAGLPRRDRWQQRRRSRRLPAGPAGGARTRRSQPARRSRISRRTRSAACRARPVCRPGMSRPRRACPRRIPYGSEVTEEKLRMIEHAERRRCATPAFASFASATTTRSRASRSPRTKWRARSSRRSPSSSCARSGARLPARDDRPSGIPSGQPQRSASAAARRVTRLARDAGGPRSPGAGGDAGAPSLSAPSLEDIDSVNFALGVRDFDVASTGRIRPAIPFTSGSARSPSRRRGRWPEAPASRLSKRERCPCCRSSARLSRSCSAIGC